MLDVLEPQRLTGFLHEVHALVDFLQGNEGVEQGAELTLNEGCDDEPGIRG